MAGDYDIIGATGPRVIGAIPEGERLARQNAAARALQAAQHAHEKAMAGVGESRAAAPSSFANDPDFIDWNKQQTERDARGGQVFTNAGPIMGPPSPGGGAAPAPAPSAKEDEYGTIAFFNKQQEEKSRIGRQEAEDSRFAAEDAVKRADALAKEEIHRRRNRLLGVQDANANRGSGFVDNGPFTSSVQVEGDRIVSEGMPPQMPDGGSAPGGGRVMTQDERDELSYLTALLKDENFDVAKEKRDREQAALDFAQKKAEAEYTQKETARTRQAEAIKRKFGVTDQNPLGNNPVAFRQAMADAGETLPQATPDAVIASAPGLKQKMRNYMVGLNQKMGDRWDAMGLLSSAYPQMKVFAAELVKSGVSEEVAWSYLKEGLRDLVLKSGEAKTARGKELLKSLGVMDDSRLQSVLGAE